MTVVTIDVLDASLLVFVDVNVLVVTSMVLRVDILFCFVDGDFVLHWRRRFNLSYSGLVDVLLLMHSILIHINIVLLILEIQHSDACVVIVINVYIALRFHQLGAVVRFVILVIRLFVMILAVVVLVVLHSHFILIDIGVVHFFVALLIVLHYNGQFLTPPV